MSHVTTVDVNILDLNALEKAAADCGLEFRRDKKTYNWWGVSEGDYPIPEGFTKDDLGKCEHAIGIPGKTKKGRNHPYEIGVVSRRDGQAGYALLWDFYNGGNGLQKLAGKDCINLRREYAKHAAINQCKAQGFTVRSVVTHENGTIEIQAAPASATVGTGFAKKW